MNSPKHGVEDAHSRVKICDEAGVELKERKLRIKTKVYLGGSNEGGASRALSLCQT